MPRVFTKTKSTRGKEYRCVVCGEKIAPGQKYLEFKKRYGSPNRRHVEHGMPRPTELSNRKTAQIDEALSSWPESVESEDDIQTALSDIAGVARDVGQEYQDSHDNLPENFQQAETGQALEEVAQELESWADDLESWSPSEDEPTEDDIEVGSGETVDENSVEEKLKELRSEWLDRMNEEARDLANEYPEYQG